jgi:hypothetical protein
MSSIPEHQSKQHAAKLDMEKSEPVDHSANHADSHDVPTGYWRSYRFIGSITAIILLANGLFIGYVMPVMWSQNIGCNCYLTSI